MKFSDRKSYVEIALDYIFIIHAMDLGVATTYYLHTWSVKNQTHIQYCTSPNLQMLTEVHVPSNLNPNLTLDHCN